MATSFSGGRSRSTRREPPTMEKQLVNFITCDCESSAPFCNLQSRALTHAVLVIGLYDLLIIRRACRSLPSRGIWVLYLIYNLIFFNDCCVAMDVLSLLIFICCTFLFNMMYSILIEMLSLCAIPLFL